MSTTPLTDGMQALINYANETTGETDTTLSDAIDSLVSAYGSGGGLVKLYEQEIELPYYNNGSALTTLATIRTTFSSVPSVFLSFLEFIGESDERHIQKAFCVNAKSKDCSAVHKDSTGIYAYYGGRGIIINISDGGAVIKCRTFSTGNVAEGTYKLTVYESPIQF